MGMEKYEEQNFFFIIVLNQVKKLRDLLLCSITYQNILNYLRIMLQFLSPKIVSSVLQALCCSAGTRSGNEHLCLVGFYRCPKSNWHCKYPGFIQVKGFLTHL